MNLTRWNFQATLLQDGRVLVTGGTGNTASWVEAETFDPVTEAWTLTGSMGTPRQEHAATRLLDGRVMVVGGVGDYYSCASDASAEIYDPATGLWAATPSLPMTVGTGTIAVTLADGRVLVAGGGNRCGGVFATAALYDPIADTWTPTASMSLAREFHSATLLGDGRVLVGGGAGSAPFPLMTSAEVYDPATGSWSAVGAMATGRGGCAGEVQFLAPTLTGTVLATGALSGSCYGGTVNATADVFDPATSAWSPTGSMGSRRYATTPTTLGSGLVLVAGGIDGAPSYDQLATAEVYNPATGTWAATGSLTTTRSSHTATLLLDGRVLIAGGSAASVFTATAELYTPVSQPPPTFTDGFEGAALDPFWTFTPGGPVAGSAQLTTSVVHGGSQSLAVSWVGNVGHDYGSPRTGTISVWMQGSQIFGGSAAALELVDPQSGKYTMIGQGGNCCDNTNFGFRSSAENNPATSRNTTWTGSGTDWHHLELTVNASGVTAKFDGVEVGSDPSVTQFQIVYLEVWGGWAPSAVAYFDDFVETLDPLTGPTVAHLTVIKHVVNDNNGTAAAGAWTMNVTATNPSSASFPGSESGTTITLAPGSFSVTESGGPSGYVQTGADGCAGTLAAGQSAVCILTNDDQPLPSLGITKTANASSYYYVGQVITYSYVVKNTGYVNLSGPFSVSDDKLGSFQCGSANLLAPGATTSCAASYTIKASDIGSVSSLPTGVPATVYTGQWLGGALSTQDTTISGSSAAGVPDGVYPGWCIQDHVAIDLHNQAATLYTTTNVGAIPADARYLPWGQVNWILNHKIRGAGKSDLAFFKDVQTAIWVTLGEQSPTFGISADAMAMINDGLAHSTFVPGPGDVVAVIVYSDGMAFNPNSIQESILEMKLMQSITNTVVATGSLGSTPVSSAPVSLTIPQTVERLPIQGGNGPAVDRFESFDGTGTRTTSPLALAATGEVVLALVASDGPSSGGQQAAISSTPALTWTLVKRTNTQRGTAEIWKAVTPSTGSPLTNLVVTSTLLKPGYHQTLNIMTFTNATGTGALASASAASGAPSAQLVTTKANSLVVGIGNDWDSANARALGANQVMAHQWIDSSIGDTYFLQAWATDVPIAGTKTRLHDIAPTTDRWNFTIVEVVK